MVTEKKNLNIYCGFLYLFFTSVGSLGKWPDDKGSTGILVENCTFTSTMNGARIKTWAGTTSGEASNIVYQNLLMKNVKNPIIIDQNYGKYKKQVSLCLFNSIAYNYICSLYILCPRR